MNNERRNFIKLSTTLAAGMLVSGSFSGCFDNKGKMTATNSNNINYDEKDIRFIVLSYAILAPNPHNKQPWLIELKDKFNRD